MTPQELKNSILQLAIQGKLVEQRPEEGTAEELFQKIQEEKQRLIAEKKIKKEKPLPEITEDEKPFDIPESWKWVRLKDICIKIVDGDHNPPAGVNYTTDFIMISAKNINYDNLVNLDQVRYITKDIFDTVNQRTNVNKGDILLTIVGTLGRSCVYNADYNICFQRSVSVLQTLIYNYYLKYTFDAPFIQQFMMKSATGTAQKGFYLKQLEKILIPIPPLAEQKRIVAKIEELLPCIDRYEKVWSKLEQLNKRFPEDMKKSLLQYAIEGKLVEQRPEEGTGEELFQKIQEEKQRLIREKKIKKEKPLPEITDDEKPFDIPESWKWVRLGELCSIVTGRLDANAQTPMGMYTFFTCGVEVYKTDTYAFDCDAILLGGNNASGDYKMHRFCGKFNAYQRVYVISRPQKEILDYLYSVIKFWLPALKRGSQGTTTRFIKLSQVKELIIPFPPLAEQKRIVEKLEQLLPLCDRLK